MNVEFDDVHRSSPEYREISICTFLDGVCVEHDFMSFDNYISGIKEAFFGRDFPGGVVFNRAGVDPPRNPEQER